MTEFTAFRRPEKLPKENMIRGVKSILQNNNGELPLDVEIARRILEEWRDERITDEGQGRHK